MTDAVVVPVRIQRKRTAGWRLPPNTVVVDRTSRFGNPFTVQGAIGNGFASNEADARKLCVERFREWLLKLDPGDQDRYQTHNRGRFYDRLWMLDNLHTLAGQRLACTCPDDGQPCHADVLLAVSNGRGAEDAAQA